jgi:hypothetical protein
MPHFDVMNVLFVMLNSGLLFGLMWYVFKKKMVPGIKNNMQEQDEELLFFTQEKERLGQVHVVLNEQIMQQQQLYDELSLHIDAWKAHEGQCQQIHAKEEEKVRRYLIDTLEKREQYRTTHYTMRHIWPDALAQARILLEKRYADPAHADAFMAQAYRAMKE